MKNIFKFLLKMLNGNKEKDKENHGHHHEKQICDWGIKKFNERKRPIEEAPGGVKGKKPKPQPPSPSTTTTTTVVGEPSPGGTIYLDFWGQTVSGTMWNTNGDFTVGDAGLSQVEVDYVLASVTKHYEPFNVVVTTDESVYDATPSTRRIRVCLTESNEWYGNNAGGVAYINSFFWGDGSPAFVFTKLLNYSVHNIAEAAAHEAGHALGLRHQSTCVDGVITSQYNWGDGTKAPTMGASYNVLMGEWYIDGPTPLGCQVRQNDVAILTAALGLK